MCVFTVYNSLQICTQVRNMVVRDLGTSILCLPKLTYLESVQSVISIDYIAAIGAVGTAGDTNRCVHPYAVISDIC